MPDGERSSCIRNKKYFERRQERLCKIEELRRAPGELTFKLSHREQAGMDKRGRTGGGGDGGIRVGVYLRQEKDDEDQDHKKSKCGQGERREVRRDREVEKP